MNKTKKYLTGVIVILAISMTMFATYFYTERTKKPNEMERELAHTKKLLEVPVGSITDHFLVLRSEEMRETYYMFYTRNSGPEKVNYTIYRVQGVYKKEEIPMPEGLIVSIEPSEFVAEPHKKYTSKITIKTNSKLESGIYTLYLHASFGKYELLGDDWIRIEVLDDYSIPGISGVYSPWGQLHDNSITLKPGETKETYYTLHTGEGGPGNVTYTLFRMRKEYGEDRLPIPKGLTVTIEPNKFLARSHEDYTSKLTIKTSSELLQGKYVLSFNVYFENEMKGEEWIIINVES